jgi:hypothetical protein
LEDCQRKAAREYEKIRLNQGVAEKEDFGREEIKLF